MSFERRSWPVKDVPPSSLKPLLSVTRLGFCPTPVGAYVHVLAPSTFGAISSGPVLASCLSGPLGLLLQSGLILLSGHRLRHCLLWHQSLDQGTPKALLVRLQAGKLGALLSGTMRCSPATVSDARRHVHDDLRPYCISALCRWAAPSGCLGWL